MTVDELIVKVVKHCVIVLTMFSMVRLNLQGRWSRQTDTDANTQKWTSLIKKCKITTYKPSE